MKALKLIIHREYVSRVRTKAFILTTILTPLIFLVVMIVPALLSSINKSEIQTVYVMDRTGMYEGIFETYDGVRFSYVNDTNYERNSSYALLQIGADLGQYPKSVTFYSDKQQPPRDLLRYINDVLTQAVKNKKVEDFTIKSNIEPATLAQMQKILGANDRIQAATVRLNEDGQASDTLGDVAVAVGMGSTFIMFFFISMYGSIVMQSVVEEKSNRIVEIIISSARPFDLMMGKIIGVGLSGLTQIAIWIVLGIVGLIGLTLFGANVSTSASAAETQQVMQLMNETDISSLTRTIFSINWAQVAVCFILYFVGGYLLFASLFAMFGSAANDSQEAQQFIMPVMAILMIAFYAGFAAAGNPEGSVATWCSIIPFTSPIVMMVRAPFDVPLWQIGCSLAVLFVTSYFTIKLAGKIYRTGILMTGKKAGFKELLKWISYK